MPASEPALWPSNFQHVQFTASEERWASGVPPGPQLYGELLGILGILAVPEQLEAPRAV